MTMHRRNAPRILFLASWLLLTLPGCPSPKESDSPSSSSGSAAPTPSDEVDDGLDELVAADEAYIEELLAGEGDAQVPPAASANKPESLERLDAEVEWEEMPVVDTYELYKEHLAKSKPQVTPEEALKLRNTSPEANEKILSALGRPPRSDADAGWDGTLTRSLRMDLKSTNPLMISSTAEFEVLALTGVSLFTFDWNFIPYANADCVKSWHSSKDRLYDKVVMRDDLIWSDGTPITAHDVAFSYTTILDDRIPIPAVRAGTDQIAFVEALDDYTVIFGHKQALATNVWNVSFPVIPKHIYEKSIPDDYTMGESDYHLKYERNPICGGPYEIIKRIDKQEIVIERREEWYEQDGNEIRRKPFFKQIRFRVLDDPNTALLALKKGEIDDWELTPEQWQSQTDGDDFYQRNTKVYGLEWTYGYIGWNVSTPFFNDKRVRWAMSYAFDHDEMLKNILYGLYESCRGIYHESAWMAPRRMPKPLHQDLDKAEELLDEAGWTDTDGDGYRDKEVDGRKVKFEFTLNIPNGSATAPRIAELLKDNLDQIGVSCIIKPTEFTVMQEKARTHEFHAQLAAWGTGTDPSTSENLWKTGEGRNYGEYSNPVVDRLFKLGEREFDPEKRAIIYGKIASLLWEDQPYTWLYNRSSFFGFNHDLRGYMFSPRGPYTYGPGFDAIWKVAE
jgi:peptide/nickel transport system substrate-binding protein